MNDTERDDALRLAAKLVASFEGFRAAPYRDQAGIWTIGYGTIRAAGKPVTVATPPVTNDQALALMMGELQATFTSVCAHVPTTARAWQIAALTSFAYNVGINALLGSTLLRMFNIGDPAAAAAQFPLWNKIHDPVTHQLVDSRGLTNRRRSEALVFIGGTVGAGNA